MIRKRRIRLCDVACRSARNLSIEWNQLTCDSASISHQSIRQLKWINIPIYLVDESRSTCLAIWYQLRAKIMLSCRIMFQTFFLPTGQIAWLIEIAAKTCQEQRWTFYPFSRLQSRTSLRFYDCKISSQELKNWRSLATKVTKNIALIDRQKSLELG